MLGTEDSPRGTSVLHWLRTPRNLHFTRLQCFLIDGEPIACIFLPGCQAILRKPHHSHSQGFTVKVKVSVTRLCTALWHPRDCSPKGSSVPGLSQARLLEHVAISFSGSSRPRDRTLLSPYMAGGCFTFWADREGGRSTPAWPSLVPQQRNGLQCRRSRRWRFCPWIGKSQVYRLNEVTQGFC